MKCNFSECVAYKGSIYAYEVNYGCLVSISCETGKGYFLELKSPFKNLPGDALFNMCMSKGFIFAVESRGENIFIYDINQNKVKYSSIDIENDEWNNVALGFVKDDVYYIFPRYSSNFYSVTPNGNEVRKKQYRVTNDKIVAAVANENGIIFLYTDNEEIIRYDLVLSKSELYKADAKSSVEFISLCFANDNLYGLTRKGEVIKIFWKDNMFRCELVANLASESNDDKGRMTIGNGYIIGFPIHSNSITAYNSKEKKTILITDYPKDFEYVGSEEWSKYYGYCEDESYYYWAMRSANYIIKIRKIDGKILFVKPQFEEKRSIRTLINNGNGIVKESEISLKMFIDGVVDDE